jgi:transaldolase
VDRLDALGEPAPLSNCQLMGQQRHEGRVRVRRPLRARARCAPFTVNTMPEKTLLAFGDHGHVDEFLPTDGGNAEQVIARFAAAGVDVAALAARLQDEGADAFVASWDELIENIGQKTSALTAA